MVSGSNFAGSMPRSAIDDADPILRHVMPLGDEAGGIAGIGDDAVAARHDAVIEILEWSGIAIGAMKGRDERPPGTSRGDEGAPGRRPASRMHEAYTPLLDETRKPPRIGENGEGILARQRQGNDLAAGFGHGGCHPPPFGGNQGRRARPGERFGDLDGCKLAPPGVEARHDLQYAHIQHGPRFLGWPLTNRNSSRSARAKSAGASPIA
jgi:hypothetical protein